MSKRKATTSKEEAAWQKVTAALAKDGVSLCFTEYSNPCTTWGGWPSALAASEITKECVLSFPHVLLPKNYASAITKIHDNINQARQRCVRAVPWSHAFWYDFLIPLAKEAVDLVEADKMQESLRPLLAVALYCSAKSAMGGGDFWLSYQGATDAAFIRFFDDYSLAWRAVLASKEKHGLSAVCLDHLLSMLGEWEDDVNAILKSVTDEKFAEKGLKIRMKLLQDEDYSEYSASEEDDDGEVGESESNESEDEDDSDDSEEAE